MGGIPVPPHPTQPQRVRAGPRGCRGRLCSLRSPTTPELHGAGSFPDGSPAPLSQHPPLPTLQERRAAHALPPDPPIPPRPLCEAAGRCCMCVYTCLYVHTYMQCPGSFFTPRKKSPGPAHSHSLCLDFGDSPHSGQAPPFPTLGAASRGCPGGPRGSGPAPASACVCIPAIRTLVPMGQAAVGFHPAVVSLTPSNTLLDQVSRHCRQRGGVGGSLVNVCKGVYKGCKHPPSHQQASLLRDPIPSTLPPQLPGFGKCLEPWQTKPAGSWRSVGSPPTPAPGTGRHWAAGTMGTLILLPAAITAQELGDPPIAGLAGMQWVLGEGWRREGGGWGWLGSSARRRRGRVLSLWSPRAEVQNAPRGLSQGGGDALPCPHPTKRSRFQPPLEPDPGGLEASRYDFQGFGKGLDATPRHGRGGPLPPPFPPQPPQKVLSGRAKPWKVLSLSL